LRLFPWQKPKEFFKAEERQALLEAIRTAEQQTSGEVRLFVESHCRFVDPLDRAAEIFHQLKMDQTTDRNAVLVYVAMKDRQLAVFGDAGIHKKVGDEYWNVALKKMIAEFNRENYAKGIQKIISDIGQALNTHFPYNNETDKNELPDDMVFGR
jgi:uncharacterized membrane protein